VPVAGVGNISASAFDVFVSSANARTFFWKAYGK
jgi:hypothetical protein